MRNLLLSLSLIAVLFGVNGCGGGGGATSGSQVYINGEVLLSGAAYTPIVMVTNSDSSGSPYAGAAVSINGSSLTYNSAYSGYGGPSTAVTPDSNGKFNLTVTLNGSTYTASAAAFTTAPSVTFPSPFTAASANTVAWTAPTGATGAINYFISLYSQQSGTPSVYSTTTTSLNNLVPANTTAAGNAYGYIVMAIQSGSPISGAASGSAFYSDAEATPQLFTAQ